MNFFLSTPLIVAQATGATASADTVRNDIQWMPPGQHEIVPTVNGKPQRMTITVDQALAHQMIAEFGRLRSEYLSGNGDEPFIDFAHEGKAAAGHPSELYWAGDDLKTGGIRAKVVWTQAGQASIADKQYTRFSPQWSLDPETGAPVGLMPNMGGLVNHAAFGKINRVRAGGAGDARNANEQTMTPEQIQAACAAAVTAALQPVMTRITAIETAQAAAAAKPGTATAGAGTPDAALVSRIESIENAVKGTHVAHAKGLVAAAVQAGRIAPQDTAMHSFWEGAILAQGASAEAALNSLPINPALQRVAQGGSGNGAAGNSGDANEHAFVTAAKAHAAAKGVDLAQATIVVAAAQPDLYRAYHATVAPKKP